MDVARRDDREIGDVLWALRDALVGAARQGRGAFFQLMLLLALVAGLSAASLPAQAQTQTFSATSETIIYVTNTSYNSSPIRQILYFPPSNDQLFYSAFSVPAGKVYASASINYQKDASVGDSATVNISLLSARPTIDAAGQGQIVNGATAGSVGISSSFSSGTITLSADVVARMNQLSASGGGTLYLGAYVTGAPSALSARFSQFDLTAELVPPPTISGMYPERGLSGMEALIGITGTNLADVTSVTFDGVAGTIGRTDANEISVTAPARAAGAVDVVVTTPGGSLTRTAGFTYVDMTISGLSVSSGPTDGETRVTITGTGLFSTNGGVRFGGQTVLFTGDDGQGTQIFVETRPQAAGTVDVVVTSSLGSSVTLANGFTFVPPAPVASSTTVAAVAYNTGSASATTFSLAGNVTNSPAGYDVGSATTANGGSVSITNAGLVSYTPPVGFRGNDSFTFTARNAGGLSSPATVTVPVSDPVITVTLPESTGQVGVDYNTSNMPITLSGGRGPYTVTNVTGYPYNLTYNLATGVLSGRVLEEGNWTLQFTVTDSSLGANYTTTIPVTLVTTRPPAPTARTFTAPLVAYNTGSAPRTAIDLAAHVSGIGVTYGLSNGSGTTGLITTANGGRASVNIETGHVDYTPPVGFRGNDSFQYQASNFGGFTSWTTVTVPVGNPTLTVVLPESTGQVGLGYNTSNTPITISGGQGPYTVTAISGYPRSLSFNAATQVLSGVVRVNGTWPVVFTITDSSTGAPYTATASATLVTNFPLPPTAASFTAATVVYNTGAAATEIIELDPHAGGHVEGYVLRRTDGTSTLSVTTALGGTATIDGATGRVSYVPPVGVRGDDSFLYATGNAGGSSPSTTVTVPIGNPTLTVTLPANTGTVGVAYNSGGAPVTITGGTAPYSNISATGLPPGLTMSSAGVISGVPTTATNATVVVTATDSSGGAGAFTSTVSAVLDISAPVITLTPASGALPGGVGGTAYNQTLTSNGGIAPIRYEVTTGSLPGGLSLSAAGLITGTPTATGTFNFTVTATDSSGNAYAGSAGYSITVAAPAIVLTPATGALPSGLRTVGYSQTFTASDGTGPYGYAVTGGALPGGLALATDGHLSGTPTTAGSHGFTVTATDTFGFTGTADYTLEIGTPVPVVQAKTVTVVGGQSVAVDVSEGAAGLDLQSAQVVTGPAHGTVSINGFVLTYTAEGAYAGPDSFTYTLTNPGGVSAPATVSITVNPAVVAGPPRTVTILAGQTATVELTDGAFGAPFTGAAVVSVTSTAGTATIVPRTGPSGQLFDLTFRPANSFSGTAEIAYTLSNAFTTSAAGTVTVIVEARPDPTQDAEVTGLITAQTETARRFASAQISNINRRLERLHDGGGGDGFSSSLSFSGGNTRMFNNGLPTELSGLRRMGSDFDLPPGLNSGAPGFDARSGRASALADAVNGQPGPARRTGEGRRDWSLWIAGAATFGTSDQAADRQGFKFDTDGLTIGADRRFGDTLALGAALGWAKDESRIGDHDTRNQTDAWSVSAYGSYQPVERAFIDAVMGYGRLDFDSRRYVTALGDDIYAYGQRDGEQWFGALTGGWDYRRSDGLNLSPYGRLEAARSELGAFTETGGGPYALHFDEQTTTTVIGAAGLRGDYVRETRFGRITPSFRIEFAHDLRGSGAATIRYADWLDGQSYLIDATPYGRNRILFGLGLDVIRGERTRFGVNYEGMAADGQNSNTVRLNLETTF